MSRQVWVGGEPVALSKKEFALLRALAGDPNKSVLARGVTARRLGVSCHLGHTRTLDSHAFRLRHKLNRSGDRFVSTCGVSGTGWSTGALES